MQFAMWELHLFLDTHPNNCDAAKKLDDYKMRTEKLVKENLKAAGVKMNTIVNLDIYYQPEEGDIYYVATTKDGKELSNEEALKIEE